MTSIAHNAGFDHPSRPLLVKELAAALGVGLRFVYQMRACGFPMRGDIRQRQMATLEEARAWIKANNFRLKDSVGKIGTAKSAPARTKHDANANKFWLRVSKRQARENPTVLQ